MLGDIKINNFVFADGITTVSEVLKALVVALNSLEVR